MIELTVTSIPFVLRILYLRWKGLPITLYNVHMALFAWLALAFIVFFTVFYYYPKSYTGFVPFRTVPVVSENGGTVTAIKVDNGSRVKPGQVLFTVDNTTETAAVKTAELKLAEIEKSFASAEAEVHAAQASLDRENAELEQAKEIFDDQDELRRRKSPAYNERRYQAATELGLRTVAIFSHEDRVHLHRYKADEAYLVGRGKAPIDAYLGIDQILDVAQKAQVDTQRGAIRADLVGPTGWSAFDAPLDYRVHAGYAMFDEDTGQALGFQDVFEVGTGLEARAASWGLEPLSRVSLGVSLLLGESVWGYTVGGSVSF